MPEPANVAFTGGRKVHVAGALKRETFHRILVYFLFLNNMNLCLFKMLSYKYTFQKAGVRKPVPEELHIR